MMRLELRRHCWQQRQEFQLQQQPSPSLPPLLPLQLFLPLPLPLPRALLKDALDVEKTNLIC
jgi:hypothetical protein